MASTTNRPTLRLAAGICLCFFVLLGARGKISRWEELRKIVEALGLDADAITAPLAIDQSMRAFAQEAVEQSSKDPKQRMQALLDHLTDPERLRLSYRWGHTGSNAEVFGTGEANCLAFTNLYIGLARAVGLPVYYILILDHKTFRREEDLVIVSDHVAVGFGVGQNRLMIDLAAEPITDPDPRKLERIADITALAFFYTNQGAEALRRDDVAQGLESLRTAVALESEQPSIWINYGVALRRSGQPRGAEDAYRKALELDPRATSALANLASLLRLEGRQAEAEAVERLLARRPGRNPFTYLSLGDISLSNGRPEEAARLYRRALRLNRSDAEAWAALGQAALAVGDQAAARRHLRKARKRAVEHPRIERLAVALGASSS